MQALSRLGFFLSAIEEYIPVVCNRQARLHIVQDIERW